MELLVWYAWGFGITITVGLGCCAYFLYLIADTLDDIRMLMEEDLPNKKLRVYR